MAHSQKVFACPPLVEHEELTQQLTAKGIAAPLAEYLERSREAPWMHPDAWLSTDGVRHGPKSGPSGGWAIHHLRRIEAGLRGESLVAETKEELVEKFGEDVVKNAPFGVAKGDLHVGDDTHVDAVIEGSVAKIEDEKTRRKREKKERAQREKADKENQPSNKRKRADWGDSDASVKAESQAGTGAYTPYADSMTAYSDTWQRKEDFEQSQEVLVGEIGGREGAPVVKQNGEPPVIVKHDLDGEVVVPNNAKTAEEKAARRNAKKARRLEEKAREASGTTTKQVSVPVARKEPAAKNSNEVKTEAAADKASRRAAKNARKAAEKANAGAKG